MASSPHFSNAELTCKGTDCNLEEPLLPLRGCGKNLCTPELVDALEAYRVKAVAYWVGKSDRPFPGMRIHDAYRCEKHNGRTTGAVADSQHSDGRAADFSIEGFTAADLQAIAMSMPPVPGKQNPEIRGIGRDDFRNYLHVDVRQQTHLSLWCYGANGKWGAYYAPGAQPTGPISV